MEFFTVAAIIAIIILWVKVRKTNRLLKELTLRVDRLTQGTVKEPASVLPPAAPVKPISAAKTAPAPAQAAPVEVPAAPAAEIPPSRPAPAAAAPKEKPQFLKNIEMRFAENWTGILGSIILVVGIAFLGVYTALKMSPAARFVMILIVSGALLALSVVIGRKQAWKAAALWIRSSAGALFLLACLGAGAIPGLKWIEDPVVAVALLCAGVAVNLALGFLGGNQAFASLHTVLSLAALAVAPQTQTVLIVTGFTVLFGIILSFRGRWDWHLIVILTSYLAFHLRWYFETAPAEGAFPLPLRVTGIAVSAVTGIAACAIHYRALYRDRQFEAVPFVAHMLNWAYMAVCLVLYSQGSKWNTPVLAAGSMVLFLLALRARALSIRWLFITDTLVAQTMMLIAVFTLTRWDVEPLFIAALALVEIAVFVAVMFRQDSAVLTAAGGVLTHLAAMGLIVVAHVQLTQSRGIAREMAVLSAALVIILLLAVYATRRDRSDIVEAFLWGCGFTAGLLALNLQGLSVERLWSPFMIAGIAVAVLVIRRVFDINGLAAGLVLIFSGMYGICWYHLADSTAGAARSLIYALPLLVPPAAALWTSYYRSLERHVVWPALLFLFAHLSVAGYFILVPLSPFLPAPWWLLLALAALEAAYYLRDSRPAIADGRGSFDRHLLAIAYVLITAFMARHVLVHLQSELEIGPIGVRLLIALFGLAVVLFCALTPKPRGENAPSLWETVHPLLWEAFLGLAILTSAAELPGRFYPLAWVTGAFALALAGGMASLNVQRFRLYALILHWAAAFHIAFVASSAPTPSMKLIDQGWVAAILALALQFGFIIYFRAFSRLDEIEFPRPLRFLGGIASFAARKKNLAIFYPFFISMALFLFWSFDRALLTLLWVLETFLIFTLSIFLRENHFRFLSLLALAACLVRLVAHDLAQSSILTRAVVFVGVGTLMVIMNLLYTRYKDRFTL